MPLPRLRLRSAKPAAPSATPAPASDGGAKPPRTFLQRVLHNWIIPLAIVAAILTPIRQSIADWNDVPSGSMRPTILEGDRIYVNLLAYGLRVPFTTKWFARWDAPERGDIVTLRSPADGVRLVKRVIGLPGDRLAMRGNQLIINGKPAHYSLLAKDIPTRLPDGQTVNVNVQEEQLDGRAHALTIIPAVVSDNSFKELIVPPGQYFVMGDNRDMSRDSRRIGCIPLERIYGRSSYVALSVDPENNYMPRFGRWFSELK